MIRRLAFVARVAPIEAVVLWMAWPDLVVFALAGIVAIPVAIWLAERGEKK